MNTFLLQPIDRSLAERLFEKYRHKILTAFTGFIIDVQHVGATSVEGLLTKGDLDIQVRVDQANFTTAIALLEQLFTPAQKENWSACFASFSDNTEALPTGIQLTVINSSEDQYFIGLRDLLRTNTSLKEEFNQLKHTYNNRPMDEYRAAKSAFIERILNQQYEPVAHS